MIYINDLDVIENISVLFERENVIYGAGKLGRELADEFEQADIKVKCFCDKDENIRLREYNIIDIQTLKDMVKLENVNIIVSSPENADSIVADLENAQIECENVYSYAGVWHSLGLNIDSTLFTNEYRRLFKRKKEIWRIGLDIRYKMDFLFTFSLNLHIYNSCGVLVLAPAKVASSSMYESLKAVNLPCLHINTFTPNFSTAYQGKHNEAMKLFRNYFRNTSETVKIITIVREPIAREISKYMHCFTYKYVTNELLSHDILPDIQKYIYNMYINEEEPKWFDNIRDLTGIDIFHYPFDKEKGYSIIKKDNWEILLLKMESIQSNEEVIASFVDKSESFKLLKTNVGMQKLYKNLYSSVKEKMQLSEEVIDFYFKNENQYIDHFYTDGEKKELYTKYIKRCKNT